MATLSCWLSYSQNSDFPIENIPFGVFSRRIDVASNPDASNGNDSLNHQQLWRVGTRIGDYVIDLDKLYESGLFDGIGLPSNVFASSVLNELMKLNRSCWRMIRQRIISLLSNGDRRLQDNTQLKNESIVSIDKVEMHLPASIGDYTDFYCSREHATNCGIMIRGIDNALQPNWLHLPVGYHGRSSTVVVSGTDVIRPWGQIQADRLDPTKGSLFQPTQALDFELEIGFFVGGEPNPLGQPIRLHDAEDRIFGLVLLNDWSARDIQTWEYVPLGPFTSKSFCTSISPWVVTMDALEPFRCSTSTGMIQDSPPPLPYLLDPEYSTSSFDIALQVNCVLS